MAVLTRRKAILSQAILRGASTKLLLGAMVLVPWVKLELFPRVIWADALFLLWGLVLYVECASRQRPLWRPSWPLPVFGILLSIWAMALLASGLNVPHPGAYLFETAGLIYLATLSWLLAYVLSKSPSIFRLTVRALIIGLVITLAFGLIGILNTLLSGGFSPISYNDANKLIATFRDLCKS